MIFILRVLSVHIAEGSAVLFETLVLQSDRIDRMRYKYAM